MTAEQLQEIQRIANHVVRYRDQTLYVVLWQWQNHRISPATAWYELTRRPLTELDAAEAMPLLNLLIAQAV